MSTAPTKKTATQLVDKKGWESVTFGEVAREVKETCPNPTEEGIERAVGLDDLTPLDIHIRSWSNAVAETTFSRKFRRGQVLFGRRRAYQRKAALAEFDGICSGDIIVLEALEGKMDPKLLPFLVHNDRFYEWAVSTSAGSLSPRTKFKHLAEFDFRLPPIAVQKKIADLLWALDTSLEEKNKLIASLQKFKIVLLDKLLAKGVHHYTDFQKTKLGEMPKAWKVVRLGDLSRSIQYGFTASATDKQVGPKFLRITDIQDNAVDWSTVPFCKCPEIAKYQLENNDIVFARTGATTGKSFLVKDPPEAVFASYLIRVKVGEELVPEFINLFFQSSAYWRQIRSHTAGSAQGGFNASKLANLQIVLPSKEEQLEIVSFLSKVEQNIRQGQLASQADRALRQSIVNDYL